MSCSESPVVAFVDCLPTEPVFTSYIHLFSFRPISGEFSDGGQIAVECSPLLVAEIDTKGRFGKVDGRFPHWVTPYEGERFSLIYVSDPSFRNLCVYSVGSNLQPSSCKHCKQYVTSGSVEPQTTAIFAPPPDVARHWIPPPTFVP